MADEFVEGAGALEDKTQKKGGGPGGGRKGGKGGRGGGGAQSREMLVSKALSKLLRHQAENAGIQLDEGGYAPLDKVVSLHLISVAKSVHEACFMGGKPGRLVIGSEKMVHMLHFSEMRDKCSRA